jgi:hypothetical protein
MALRNTLSHLKTRKLALALDIQIPHALGIAEALFDITARLAPRGDIGRLTDEDIALAMFSTHDPPQLVRALHESGWLDADPVHRFIVHDWHDHADDATDSKVGRSGLDYASGSPPRLRKMNTKDREQVTSIREEKAAERAAEKAQRDDLRQPAARGSASQRVAARTSTSTSTSTEKPSPSGEGKEPPPPSVASLDLEANPKSTVTPAAKSSILPITLTSKAQSVGQTTQSGASSVAIADEGAAEREVPNRQPHKAVTRARDAARGSAADDDDPRDPGMVSRGVMDTLRIAGRWTSVALEKVCRLELDADPQLTSTGLHDSMVQSYRRWQHERPDIFANWKTEDFFGDGHWRNPEQWPRRGINGNATEPVTAHKTIRELVRERSGASRAHH